MTPDDLLATDPGLRRCLDALSGQRIATLDDYVACYGDEETAAGKSANSTPPAFVSSRDLDREAAAAGIHAPPEESSAALAAQLGLFFRLSDGGAVVPRDVVETINRSYGEVSKHGYLTEADLEGALLAWLSEATG